jgi:hypothetical protein
MALVEVIAAGLIAASFCTAPDMLEVAVIAAGVIDFVLPPPAAATSAATAIQMSEVSVYEWVTDPDVDEVEARPLPRPEPPSWFCDQSSV